MKLPEEVFLSAPGRLGSVPQFQSTCSYSQTLSVVLAASDIETDFPITLISSTGLLRATLLKARLGASRNLEASSIAAGLRLGLLLQICQF